MNSAGKTLINILTYTHLRPISLAGKCRLLFGIAIVFVLSLALLTPYFWMGKLTEKTMTDAGRAVVNTVYERHFKVGKAPEKSPVMLDESGAVKQAAKALDFEKAALIRDRIVELRQELVIEDGQHFAKKR